MHAAEGWKIKHRKLIFNSKGNNVSATFFYNEKKDRSIYIYITKIFLCIERSSPRLHLLIKNTVKTKILLLLK